MILERFPHEPADLELHSLAGWNVNTFERLWILSHSGSTFLDFKDTEVSEFKPVSLTQFVDHLIEERLNRPLDVGTLLLGGVRDSVDEIFFRCRSHQSPLSFQRSAFHETAKQLTRLTLTEDLLEGGRHQIPTSIISRSRTDY